MFYKRLFIVKKKYNGKVSNSWGAKGGFYQ